jgi:hypothetical protein
MSDEREAKEFLKNRQRMPWDEPMESAPAQKPASKKEPEKPKNRVWLDEVDKMASDLADRNKKIADKTRYLREN